MNIHYNTIDRLSNKLKYLLLKQKIKNKEVISFNEWLALNRNKLIKLYCYDLQKGNRVKSDIVIIYEKSFDILRKHIPFVDDYINNYSFCIEDCVYHISENVRKNYIGEYVPIDYLNYCQFNYPQLNFLLRLIKVKDINYNKEVIKIINEVIAISINDRSINKEFIKRFIAHIEVLTNEKELRIQLNNKKEEKVLKKSLKI